MFVATDAILGILVSKITTVGNVIRTIIIVVLILTVADLTNPVGPVST